MLFRSREQLDTSYVDINDPENTEDDVVGAFRNGWGMFIINPNAEREQVIIQVPHPCDDFIAPYVALDLFLQVDSYAFMINGAGREVYGQELVIFQTVNHYPIHLDTLIPFFKSFKKM